MNERMLCRINAGLALGLSVFYLAWWLADGAPVEALNITLLVVAIVPLLMVLPGLWRGRRFQTALAGLIVPFHFAYATMELIANPEVRGWVAIQTFLTFLLFAGVMAALRQIRQP